MEAKASNNTIRQRLKGLTGQRVPKVSDARIEDFQTLRDSYEPPKEIPAANLRPRKPRKTGPK